MSWALAITIFIVSTGNQNILWVAVIAEEYIEVKLFSNTLNYSIAIVSFFSIISVKRQVKRAVCNGIINSNCLFVFHIVF